MPSPQRLSPTALSQYIRLENCERYLYMRLHPSEEKRLRKLLGVTIQPLTPLLQELGRDFEKDVASRLAAQGLKVVDLEKEGFDQTLANLKQIDEPTVLLQASVEAPLGRWTCAGEEDI